MISTSKNRFRSRALAQAAAATPALALISTAHAQTIIWSGVLDQSITASSTISGQTVNLDFNSNGTLDTFEGYLESLYSTKEDVVSFIMNAPGTLRYKAVPVVVGDFLPASNAASSGGVLYSSDPGSDAVPAGTSAYYGLKFTDGAGTHAGWMQVSVSADGFTATLNQWAYSSEASIFAGQTSAVPEPATYGVVCGLALAGWGAVRRRRQLRGEERGEG